MNLTPTTAVELAGQPCVGAVTAGWPYSGAADDALLDDATARLLAWVADRGATS